MEYLVNKEDIDRYKRLEELVLEHLSDSFYIYEILRDMSDCRDNYTDGEIISCLDKLVDGGVLRHDYAKYERII